MPIAAWRDKPLHDGQRAIFDNAVRFRVAACGRRFGKSQAALRHEVYNARSGKAVWWVSPTYLMAQDVWQELILTLEELPDVTIDRSHKAIRFDSGGVLAVKSGHEPDRLRGSGLDSVTIDEAAFCTEYVWHVLRPALSDKAGGANFLSTPNGRNWFWRLFQRGLDPLEREWQSWHFPTSANPLIRPEEIESARRDLTEQRFNEEYLAAFSEDSGQVFRGVSECIAVPPEHATDVVFGVDWGRSNDYTVIVALDRRTRKVLAIDRFNQINWTLQRGRLLRMAQQWQPRLTLAESNSIGEPNIEELVRAGLHVEGFVTTASSKPPLIDALALAIENKEIGIVDDPVLISELQAYEMERLPGGSFRYNAPAGGHDDTVIALALAWWAVISRQPATVTSYYDKL